MTLTRYAALLRGINVGGRKIVAMADVRAAFAALGFANATTILQSGNVLFDAPRAGDAGALERRLTSGAAQHLGLEIGVFVRSAAGLARVVAANPFATEARENPSRVVVMFLDRAADAAKVASLQAGITGPERVAAAGRELYVTYPAGIGTSRLTGAVIERKLGVRGTARNWATVLRLLAGVQDRPSAESR